MGRFFVIESFPKGEHEIARTDYLQAEPYRTEERETAQRCPHCGGYISALAWLPPYRVELECWGRIFGDMVFGPGSSILVSERFKDLYEHSGLTGLAGFEPVEVTRVKRYRRIKGDPPRYYRVSILPGRAVFDPVASELEDWDPNLKVCPECRSPPPGSWFLKRYARVVLEPGTWGGEDLFRTRGPLGVEMASERFKQFCEAHEIKNAVLIPAEEYWRDFYPQENFKRAREILAAPVGGHILEKRQPNGDVWRYDTRTNYLVITSQDGTIKAIDRPFEGIEYWNRH